MEEKTAYTLAEAHLHFAKSLNGETWTLLEKQGRTAEDDERMLAAAHASHYHWLCASPDALHRQRGEYLIARVYLALGNVREALAHARRCLELTDRYADDMDDFDSAFAYEMFARANAAAGNEETARDYRAMAHKAGEQIADAEDREIFMADFQGGDWYGI